MRIRAGAVGEAMGIDGFRKVVFVVGGEIGREVDMDLSCFQSAFFPVMHILDFTVIKAAIYGPPNLTNLI
jgi:hypothetical protein